MLENLAPAGNRDSLDRAVAAGADAVYLGCSAFSARAGAGNFDEAQLREAVRFAHLHHVRVHVTVNTLIKDAELDEVLALLRMLDEVRVDAVLVQDLGVLALARKCLPDLPIHASTQMAIHNASGAAWCRRQGMSRAVLARECSAAEIEKAAKTGIEIEVFGHGAQCVGVSGECLFSSMVGERSGNRGRCAQPCRLEYTYRGQRAAWLSPRDVCMRDDLPALAKAGACSIKLEGRLKRPEYVATVAGSYRRAIDAMAAGRFQKADADEKRDLLQIFQRGGFMRGYAMGCEDAGVIYPERVNHGGVTIGRITDVKGGMARLLPDLTLHDGDQLQLRGHHPDCEMIYSGRETAAGQTAMLRLREDMQVRPGDEVVRLTDSEQLARARALTIPAIPADMTLIAVPGEALELTMTDGESYVTVTGGVTAQAQNRAMTAEDARRSLSKLGDTPFELRELTVETHDAFVPVSALNSLRREAADALAEARCDAFARRPGEYIAPETITLPRGTVPATYIVRSLAQADGLPQDARLVWYPEDWCEEALEAGLAVLPQGAWLQLPTVCEQATLEMIHAAVTCHAAHLGGVVLGSVGQLGLAWPVPFGAGSGVPVMNRRAAAFLLAQGCAFVTASCELTGRELEKLMAGEPPILTPAYGRAQLMLLHHCPARTYLGLTSGHAACAMCDRQATDALAGTELTDRRGYAYPLLRLRMPEGCLVRLMNAAPTNVLRQVREAGYAPLIELTDETDARGIDMARGTTGHWSRAVE